MIRLKMSLLTVVRVVIIGGWKGYLSLSKISKLKRSILLSMNYDFTKLLSISSYNTKAG